MNIFTETGIINRDGVLMMPKGALNQWCKEHIGARVFVRFEAVEPDSCKALEGYYYKVVVPQVRAGLDELGTMMSEKDVRDYLREVSPVTDHGQTEINALDKWQLGRHVEFIRQWAAENLYVTIADPNTI